MACLLLRFEAPLMSFGGVLVDHHNVTERYPASSMLAGLIANALGYGHADTTATDAIQARLIFAARWDVEPTALVDYHTVDLGQDHLREPGWTTRGQPEHREGGAAARMGTHQRYRHYLANGVMTLSLTLRAGEDPAVESVQAALRKPARPLFIGRKTCLPSSRLLLGRRDTDDVLSALAKEPAHHRAARGVSMPACWPPGYKCDTAVARTKRAVSDQRDWSTQLHVGARSVIEGELNEVPRCT